MTNFVSKVNEMIEKMAEIDVKKSIFLKKSGNSPKAVAGYCIMYMCLVLNSVLFFRSFVFFLVNLKNESKAKHSKIK